MQADNNKTRALGLLFFYTIVVNVLVFYSPVTFFGSPDVAAVNTVQFNVNDANSLGLLDSAGWQDVSLPDSWYENHSQADQIWYRANISIDKITDKPWGVYLPSVAHNAAVYINDLWVGQGGSFSEPVSRHHNEPLLFSFSSKLLQSGQNKIDIRVKAAFWQQGLLDQFYVAPMEQLQTAYSWKHFARVDLVRWITISMFIMSLIVLSFWVARPQDTIYAFFTLVLVFWASHNLNLLVSDIPVSARLWEAMVMSTLGWTIVALIFFNHRYAEYKNSGLEKFIVIFASLGLAIFFLPDVGSVLQIGYKVWDVFVFIFGCYAILFLVIVYLQKPDQDIYLILVAGVPMLAFGLHDILLINHYIDQRDGLIMHYGLVFAILLFSWFLIRRFVQAINNAENLATTLEKRVQVKSQALEEQYKKLQALEKQHVLSNERERIMRDIHDGIGGQLISIIGLLQESKGAIFTKIRSKIQNSLTDLRFVIDSLDPVLSDVPTLLGMMRLRLVDQLESANIELEWAVTELPVLEDMSPSRSLHIMRIVQEAITNSIKHSGSNKMKLATGVLAEAKQIFIDIIDYGKGFEQELSTLKSNSRGIKNMYYRTEQLGADLDISCFDGCTRVRLLMGY